MPTATPCDGGDQRLAGMGEAMQEPHHLRPQPVHVLGGVEEILQVVAGGERARAAGDHDAADVLAAGGVFERGRQRLVHRVGEGVLLGRAVEPHDAGSARRR